VTHLPDSDRRTPLTDDLDPSAPLGAESYPDAVMVPTTANPRPKRMTAMKMGVLDRSGKVVKKSLLWRSYGRMGFPPDLTSKPRADPREVVYAGNLQPHFGHFILEGLSRLWYAALHPELPIAWACRTEQPVAGLNRWQREILAVLGIVNEPILIAQPMRFAGIHVPDPGYRIKDFMSGQQARFLAVYPSRRRDPGLKVWLSRAGIEHQHTSIHAARLDAELAEHGWEVVHPERLSIGEQLELLATASRVAAEEGSALHLLVLLSDVRGLEVDILCRRPDRPAERQNGNYQTIADARGFRQRLHVIPEERILAESSGHVTKVTTTLAGHLEALGVPREVDAPGPLRPMADVVARAGNGAASYLELGLGREGLYGGVTAQVRDVVRPAFRVDPRREAGSDLALFEMPFAEFFEHCLPRDRRYDVIVLDGLPSAEEVQHWFAACRAHATPTTSWVIAAAPEILAAVRTSLPVTAAQLQSTDEGGCLVFDGRTATPS
jgi:hypothetical protein